MMSDNPILFECAVAQLLPLGPSMPKKGKFNGDPGLAWYIILLAHTVMH